MVNNQGQDAKLLPGHDYHRYGEQIFAEQVKQLYALAPAGFVATVLNSLVVFLVLRGEVPDRLLVPWFAALFTVTVLRVSLVVWFRHVTLEPAEAAKWLRRFLLGLLVTGLVWGSIVPLSFARISMAHQVFIAFVLGGMAAGASSTFSTVRHSYLTFSLPALAPLALHFFLVNDNFHIAMGAMCTLFGALLWRISRYHYAVNMTSLLLRFENLEIIESLKRAKEDVEGLNAQLMAEIQAKLAAEAEVQAQQEQLEKTVAERTADLVKVNQELKNEIEERKQIETALTEAQEKLMTAKDAAEAASMAKSEFLANMSHEIRTPLAGTLGMVKLVLDMEIGAEERQLLEMAERSADSLLRIIADVLDFSRLEAGMMVFEQEDFVVAEVVRTAVEVVALSARQKGLKVTWDIAPGVPAQVRGDAGRLRQVLVNLLGNALKFTAQGSIAVAARDCGEAMPERRCILFSVRDTGVGIPPEQTEKIFGKFTQADSSSTKRYGGTGLGLALSRQIVERLGGKIWVESRVGVGSTFHFTYPLE